MPPDSPTSKPLQRTPRFLLNYSARFIQMLPEAEPAALGGKQLQPCATGIAADNLASLTSIRLHGFLQAASITKTQFYSASDPREWT